MLAALGLDVAGLEGGEFGGERGGEDGGGGGGGEEAENRLKLHVERGFDSLLRSFLQEVLEGGKWRRRLNYRRLLMTMV